MALLRRCNLPVPGMRTTRRRLLTSLLGASLALPALAWASTSLPPHDGLWVHVDTDRSMATVLRGTKVVEQFEHVAFGRGGVSPLRLKGRDKTPLGEFRITRVNQNSPFHIFLGIDYPRLEHIDRARKRGLISDAEYKRSIDHGARHGEFPQDGPLGGYIGFHGIGDGDPNVHDNFHWTQGCIALTNDQIETFESLVAVGTPVRIE